MTGHQQNPTTGYNIKGDPTTAVDLEALCKAVGINRVRVCDPYDLKEVQAVLKEELAGEEPFCHYQPPSMCVVEIRKAQAVAGCGYRKVYRV